MAAEQRTLTLPAPLCALAAAKYQQRFSSLEELLVFVLRELVRDDAAQADERERQVVQQRLRDLGYI